MLIFWVTRFRSVRHALRFVVALGALTQALPARALDSGRALTQCNHRIWQVPQGLPQASVYAVHQAHDGFLWLGTQTGLVRFDGVRFTPVTSLGDVSLDRIWVRALVEDRDHALWVGTDGQGLFRVAHGVATHFAKADGLPSDVIHALVTDDHGILWAATDHGLGQFSDGKWSTIGSNPNLSSTDIRAIAVATDGKLWIAAPDATKIYSYDGTALVGFPLKWSSSFTTVQAMLAGRSGQMWIGTSQGLFVIQQGRERRITVEDGLADNWVYCLSAGADGSMWVGTKDGFSRLHAEQPDGPIDSFRGRDGLSQSAVFSLTEDREGSLWVGTKHGLNQFLDRRAIPFTESEGLASNNTGAIFQDQTGTLWVGTQDAGLCRFDGRRFKSSESITTKDGLPCNRIISLAEDSTGDLWAGSDHGLCRLHEGHPLQTLGTVGGLASDNVTNLFNASDGTLWVGTSDGVSMIRNHLIVHLPGLEAAQHVPILAIGQSHGAVVLAMPTGLFRYQDSKLIPISGNIAASTESQWTRDVDSIFEDREGLLWIGTRGSGLRLIDGDKQTSFSIRDGLFDDDIYGINTDDLGRLWMACSQGLFWVKRDDLRRFAAGRIQSVTSNPFSPTDNLRTIECQAGVQPVVCRSVDGKLWFSTVHGTIVVDPTHIQRSTTLPPTLVVDVIVNGQHQDPTQVNQLSPGQKNLEFQYTGLSFVTPTLMKFRYQLEGFDKDWVDAGTRREAFYTNLSPGKYRFKVVASNPDSGFGDSAAVVGFTLLPRFYQRAWFFPAVAIVALVTAAALYRNRMRRIRLHIDAILAERSRIARELHDTLLQGFSGVTMEMQALLMRLRGENEQSVLAGIIQDAAACMREARRSVAGLRSARGEEGLAAAITQSATQLTEATRIRLRLKLSPKLTPLSPETEYNLLRVAHEAVANVVKHAAASWVEVALAESSGELRLAIRDDGRGFDPALPVAGQHYGLVGIRERAAQINAEVKVDSRPGKGTTLTLRLPIKQKRVLKENDEDVADDDQTPEPQIPMKS